MRNVRIVCCVFLYENIAVLHKTNKQKSALGDRPEPNFVDVFFGLQSHLRKPFKCLQHEPVPWLMLKEWGEQYAWRELTNAYTPL